MEKVLIIGGTRFIGPALIEALLRHGNYSVTAFNRGITHKTMPSGVWHVQGDRKNGFNIDERFDAVIDLCAYTGEDTKRALSELTCGFFIHMSTAVVYKKPEIFPVDETAPLGFWPLWGEYNEGKVECEEVIQKSDVSYASVRPVYILGPKNYCERESFIYSRLKQDEPIILPGDGNAKIQFVFAREVAASLLFILEKRAKGCYNIAGDDVPTLRGLVEMMARVSGFRPRIRHDFLAGGERFNPQEFPFANESLWVKTDKIKSLGMSFAPLEKSLKEDYETYYKHAR